MDNNDEFVSYWKSYLVISVIGLIFFIGVLCIGSAFLGIVVFTIGG